MDSENTYEVLVPWGVIIPSQTKLAEMVTIPEAALVAAEEIADGSDVIGLEQDRLKWLLRAVLYVDRRLRDQI